MKSHHFFAFMARMKLIKRWGLMRNTYEENDQEHSLMVAMIAHGLALIHNERYGGDVDPGRVAELAIFHEASEVITGDLASPLKYKNAAIEGAYKALEQAAVMNLLEELPEDLKGAYRDVLMPDKEDYAWKLVKAADKLSAYVKCLEERSAHNDEFLRAEENIRRAIDRMDLPEITDFLEEFAPSFLLPLDALN